MLELAAVNAMIPTKDLQRAREFYENTLGLTGVEDHGGGALRFNCADGTWFLLYSTRVEIAPATTLASWRVADMESEVAELTSLGVKFEEYDFGPGFKTEGGIMKLAFGKSAWFKDTDGNILGLFQSGT